MRNRNLILLLVFCLATATLTAAGCKRRAPKGDEARSCPPAEVRFAVAPFTNPTADHLLLAGYIPENVERPSDGVLARLDEVMAAALVTECNVNVKSAMDVAQCMPERLLQGEQNRMGALKYWRAVGRCAKAEFLIIPQIISFRERDGSAMGVEKPAKVNMSIFLMDVKHGGIVKFFHFEEEQKSLFNNILETPKFFKRKGRWLTALELTEEGIHQAVPELGL